MPDREQPRTGEGGAEGNTGRDGARLERVEEGLAFTERTVEQLSAEMAELHRRVRDLGRKLAAMEERLGKVVERVEGGGEGEEG
jgi:uncharacterized coiled-coil protein SlyX